MPSILSCVCVCVCADDVPAAQRVQTPFLQCSHQFGLGLPGAAVLVARRLVAVVVLDGFGIHAPLDHTMPLLRLSVQVLGTRWMGQQTLRASFLEKLLSQAPQGNGLTAMWIFLCLFRSWFLLNPWGHSSHLNGRSWCGWWGWGWALGT